MTEELDLTLVSCMEFDDIEYSDYPDFCDAYCSFALYNDESMTEEQLDNLNDNYRDFVYDKLINHLF